MSRIRTIAMVLAALLLPTLCFAEGLPKDEQDFFDKHIFEFVKITPQKLTSPAVVKVFAIPFYKVTIAEKGYNGWGTTWLLLAKSGGKLVNVGNPSVESDWPEFLTMLNPDFRLKSDADGPVMQGALDLVLPPAGGPSPDKTFKHSGNQWTFVRGSFGVPPPHRYGYLFQTDGDGKIVSAKYSPDLK